MLIYSVNFLRQVKAICFSIPFPAIHDSIKSELERESSVRAEAESRVRETEQTLKSLQAKYKQMIGGLQKQVEEQSNARVNISRCDQNFMKSRSYRCLFAYTGTSNS